VLRFTSCIAKKPTDRAVCSTLNPLVTTVKEEKLYIKRTSLQSQTEDQDSFVPGSQTELIFNKDVCAERTLKLGFDTVLLFFTNKPLNCFHMPH
jgi:hypothetical protein